MKGLTKRQREILDFVEEYIEGHHYSPSYREIMKHFGFSSLGSIYKHIHALKRKGFLASEKQCSRSIAPTQIATAPESPASENEFELPLMGEISSGAPIETFPQMKSVAVPRQLVKDPYCTYALQVKGDSMQEQLVSHGDLILFEAREDADPGETIIGSVVEGETFMRRYHPEGQYVRLEGSSQEATPLIIHEDELSIQGVIIGLIRAY